MPTHADPFRGDREFGLVGRLGELACEPDGSRVQCHLCGRWFRELGGSHLPAMHGVSAEHYRELVGLRPRHPLCAPQQSAVRAARLHKLIATDERVQHGMSEGAALARDGNLQRHAQQRFAERRLSIERERQLAAAGSALGARRAVHYRQQRESQARALGFTDLRDYYLTRYHAQRATLDDVATELECALSAIRGDFDRLGLRIERHRSYGARWRSTP